MPRREHPPCRPLSPTLATLLVVGGVACAAPPATRPARTDVPVAGRELPDPLAAPWTVRALPGSTGITMRLDSELISRVDSAERRDSLHAVVSATWSRLAGDADARYAGLLTDYSTSTDTAPPTTPAGLLLPIPFAAAAGDAGLAPRILRPDPAGCGLDAIATQPLREALLELPRRLEPGTTWTDSVEYTACRDSIPLRVRSTREYRALRAERHEGGAVVVLERRTRISLKGDGQQFGEPLEIRAEGEGLMELAVRLQDGFVARGSGTQELRMTMRGRRRSQELVQRTRIVMSAP